MKKRCKSLFILAFMVVLLFYRVDFAVAMEQSVEPAAEVESESIGEPTAEPELEPVEEPEVLPELELIEESEVLPGSELIEESAVLPGSELIEESAVLPEQEPIEEPEALPEPGPELIEESAVLPEQEPIEEPVAESEPGETVSTGQALIEWLEAHKNTGGTVKLTDDVVLDGEYSFCPDGINKPCVFVDTDKYTITVAGEIELLSDNHVIFSGRPHDKGIFYVAEKGLLSMQGIAVESEQYALWQEEGGGLVISDSCISGNIHYADTPFVIYQDSCCIIVEKGQTLNDVLPAQISCTVNRQGRVSNNEWMPLSWNLEGTEKQQEERQRLGLQGSFLQAASAEPVQCTAVYNDYPLTFTDVKASNNGRFYLFRGNYTKPEDALPIVVVSEYSFDGENWFTYEETKVTDTYAGFFIAVESEQRNRRGHSNIYIRLQGSDNGIDYFSNVLCYASDNLESVEDIGGGRGGGTSIINPPDEPQQSTGNASAGEEKPVQKEHADINSDSVETAVFSGTDQTEKNDSDSSADLADAVKSFDTETVNADTEQPLYAGPTDNHAEPSLHTEAAEICEEPSLHAEAAEIREEPSLSAEKADSTGEQALYAEPDADKRQNIHSAVSPQINAQTLHIDVRQRNFAAIVTGLVLLSVIVGIAGFCVHFRSGTNR